jgi:hypothetical protein
MVKSILTYLFMVGIPLAGLLWILDYGGQRIAPPAIAGTWQIEGSLTSCLGAQPSELAFQQSGRFVRVTLGDASGEARLDDEQGEQLHASVVEANGPCSSVELEGSFETGAPGSGIERFVGQATGSGCDACRGVEFVASRSTDLSGK